MAINPITLLDGTTAYAHDVEAKVNPLYTDIDNTNIRAGAGILFSKLENLSPAEIIVGSATSVPTAVAMSGDATIDNLGAITVNTSATAQAVDITDDTTTNATMYPIWVTAATGSLPCYVSSTKLYFNPNTGILTATGFAGPLTGNVTGNCSGTSGGLAAGTYNYGTGSVIVNANSCNNADTVDGYHATTTAMANRILVSDASGYLLTPTATYPTTAYQVANKAYVDLHIIPAASGANNVSGLSVGETRICDYTYTAPTGAHNEVFITGLGSPASFKSWLIRIKAGDHYSYANNGFYAREFMIVMASGGSANWQFNDLSAAVTAVQGWGGIGLYANMGVGTSLYTTTNFSAQTDVAVFAEVTRIS